MGNVYVFDIGSINVHGKELLRQFTFHQKYRENLTLEKLILEQSDEIFGVSSISWENSTRKQSSLIKDEAIISFSHAKIHVFSDFVLCLGKVNQNPTSIQLTSSKIGSKIYHNTELWTSDGEPMEFEWNMFPRFTTLQLVQEVQKFMNKIGEPEQFRRRIIFMSMFNDIMWRIKDNEKCVANSTFMTLFAKNPARHWSFTGPGSETKRCSTNNERPQSEWDRVAELMMITTRRERTPSFPSHESIVSRNAQKQRRWKIIYTLLCRWGIRLKLFFAHSFL